MTVPRPTPAAGVICLKGKEVLLIQRNKPPRNGEWSLPGGRIEWGESAAACALRELHEETGVEAELLGLVDVVDGQFTLENGELASHFILIDYAARWLSGEPVAGDDAADARFFPVADAVALVQWEETRRVIRETVERFGGQANGA